MIKTVVLFAFRRPEYTHRALVALTQCPGIQNYRVVVSIDGPHQLSDATYAAVKPFAGDVAIIRHRKHLGVADHPPAIFDGLKSDCYVSIEDDCVLAPDALHLADWFFEHHARQYPFLSLGRASKTGWERPDDILETPVIESPWAWCFTRDSWHWIRPRWNCKTVAPTGWDWSLTYTMAVNQQTALAPVLSRATNIGRDGGTHGTPEWWDEHWAGNVYSGDRPAPFSEYQIQGRLDLPFLQDWMMPELEQAK